MARDTMELSLYLSKDTVPTQRREQERQAFVVCALQTLPTQFNIHLI